MTEQRNWAGDERSTRSDSGAVSTRAPSPPYALEPLSFRFAAIATLAGRAPIGGQREVAIATYVVARLAHDAAPERSIPAPIREARATAAKNWLAAVTLPQTVRPALLKVIDRTTQDSSEATAAAVRGVITVTATFLNPSARAELTDLAERIEAQAVVS